MENMVVLQNGLRASIDWLSFTVTDSLHNVEEVVNMMGYDMACFTLMPKGGMGYKRMLKLDGYPVTVLYDGAADMGIHVSVSGSAVGEVVRAYKETLAVDTPFGKGYEGLCDTTALMSLLCRIDTVGQFSRLDLAVDDMGSQYYTIEDVVQVLQDGRCVSKFRRWRNLSESYIDGCKVGHTVYLGSRRSDIMLRVYDKGLERGGIGPWVRWELELKDSRACAAVRSLLASEDIGGVCVGILSNYFRVIVLDDCNKSRCSTDSMWAAFVDGIARLRLYVPSAPKTLDDKKDWFKRQVGPTLAGIIVADGGAMDIVVDHFEDYLGHMSRDMIDIVSRVNPDWLDCKEV